MPGAGLFSVGMVGTGAGFPDGQRAFEQGACLVVALLVLIEGGQIVGAARRVGIFVVGMSTIDGQGLVVERLGLGGLFLLFVGNRQLFQCVCQIGLLAAQGVALDVQRLLEPEG